MLAVCLLLSSVLTAVPTAIPSIAFSERPGLVVVSAGGQPVATYVYGDKEISRPYFAHVCAPGGTQITRNHPPKEGKDLVDHATFHPGIWLAFGNLDGQDSWRLRAPVRHDRFVQPPQASGSDGSFVVQNSYCRSNDSDQVACQEICRYTISSGPDGYLLVSDSLFHSPKEFFFGDQEEMGLGVRVATPITVKSGGRIVDAAGRVNEKEIWGKSAPWCDYSVTIDGHRVGVLVMPDPANFRPARYHVRDYGLLVANPFGQKVFGDAPESRVTVSAGEPFRLRFGVLLYATTGENFDRQAAYKDFVSRLPELPRPGR